MTPGALRTTDLHARHGRREVLRGVTLDVPAGSITALLGQNGSGKSTLMRVVAGLHAATRGEVRVLELPPGTPGAQRRQRVTLVPTGGAVMPGETGQVHFALGQRLYRHWSAARALDAARQLHVPLDQKAGRLSTGQRMGLALAYALGSGAGLLLLDEPSNGLDPDHRRLLAALLTDYAASGGSVLLSSHVLPEIEGLADRGVFLQGGRVVVQSDLDELREQHSVVQAILPDVLPAGALGQLETVSGVRGVGVQGRTLSIQVQGGREAVLLALGTLRPVDVQVRPRPLTEAYADVMGTDVPGNDVSGTDAKGTAGLDGAA